MLITSIFDPKNYRNANSVVAGARVLVSFSNYIEEQFFGLVTSASAESFTVELDDAEYQGSSTHHFQQGDNRVYVDEEGSKQWVMLTALCEHNGMKINIELKPGAISLDPERVAASLVHWSMDCKGAGSTGCSQDRRTAIADMYASACAQGYIHEQEPYITEEGRYISEVAFTCTICHAVERVQFNAHTSAVSLLQTLNRLVNAACPRCADQAGDYPHMTSHQIAKFKALYPILGNIEKTLATIGCSRQYWQHARTLVEQYHLNQPVVVKS